MEKAVFPPTKIQVVGRLSEIIQVLQSIRTPKDVVFFDPILGYYIAVSKNGQVGVYPNEMAANGWLRTIGG